MSPICYHYTNSPCIWLWLEDSNLWRGATQFGSWDRRYTWITIWLRGQDSNLWPQGYEPCKLPLLYPTIYLYKRQDLHLHGLVAYQPTPDGAMSIYRLSSRFERFHHSCSFYNLQHVKELCKFRCLNLCLLYWNIRSCFRLFNTFLVEEGGIEPPSCSGSLRTHSQA